MTSPAFFAIFWLPLVWSAALLLLSGPPSAASDHAERRRLLLMMLPTAVGIGLVGLAPYFPTTIVIPSPVPIWLPAAGADPGVGGSVPPSVPLLSVSASQACAVIYVAVTAWLSVRLVLAHARLTRLVNEAKPQPTDRKIRWTRARVTPFAASNHAIVLPEVLKVQLDPLQIELVIAHERAHLRRDDPAFFWRLAWVDVIFWFNPFVRRQSERCRLAAELAVDDMVVRSAPSQRRSYARSLVEVLKCTASPAPQASPAISTFSPRGVYEMRINNILRPRAARAAPHRVLFAFTLLMAPLFAVQWSYAESASGSALPFKMRPLKGKVTMRYGRPYNGLLGLKGHHKGIDIKAPHGTPIYAPGAGTVIRTQKSDKGYGYLLIIDHGQGVHSRYAHLSRFDVKVGDRVTAGMTIGRVGSTGKSTGPHLHFEVMKNGKRIDPATVTPDKK